MSKFSLKDPPLSMSLVLFDWRKKVVACLAFSKRDRVAFCGYHGWHDWYLAANLNSSSELEDHLLPGLEPNGVPKGLEGTALAFKYNDIDSLKKLLEKYPDEIGAIVMEPLRSEFPKEGFLEEIRERFFIGKFERKFIG